MTREQTGYIIHSHQESDGSVKCGLCGCQIKADIKIIAKVTPGKTYKDFMPICSPCKKDIGGKSVEVYRTEIEESAVGFVPDKCTKRYKRAVAYGMPEIKKQVFKVEFYFEKKRTEL